MSSPFTDPFYVGKLCTPIEEYEPSTIKPFGATCCGESAGGDTAIFSVLSDIREILDTNKDYEFEKESLCEILADGTEVNFLRIIKFVFDKKTGEVVREKEDVHTDLVTPYSVTDPEQVFVRKTKVVESCDDDPINSGVLSSWSDF